MKPKVEEGKKYYVSVRGRYQVYDEAIVPSEHIGHIFEVGTYKPPSSKDEQYGYADGHCSCGTHMCISTQFLESLYDKFFICNKCGSTNTADSFRDAGTFRVCYDCKYEEKVGVFQGFNHSKKLHIGCGNHYLKDWINIDKDSFCFPEKLGNIIDLKEYSSNSIDEIYASHVLDHLSRNQELDKALSECYRVLKPGGFLRVAVSDFEQVVQMYNEGLDLERLLGHIVGGHKTEYDKHGMVFDFNLLRRYLEKHDFVDVKRYDWRDFLPEGFDDLSRAYIPHLCFEGILMSLNVQATKLK